MVQKKRILIFSTAYAPFVGGAEVAVKEITDRLDGEFVMITPRMRKDVKRIERIGNIEVHRVGKGNRWDKIRLIFSGPKKAVTLGSFDIVWSIMASYAGFAVLRYKKKKPEVPFLLTLQEGDSLAHIFGRAWFVWPLFKQIFRRADYIQAISTYLADWGKRMGAHCPVGVVPNGVDINKFKIQSLEYKGALQAQLGVKKDEKIVITVSRLVSKNGVEYLIRAMERLPESVHLVIVGDGELRSKLEEMAASLKLCDRVHFLGTVSHDELPDLLAQSDVFCRPSLSEGLGNAFLEAMAAGIPVVGTRVGGIRDFLEDGMTGFVSKPKDAASTAEVIKRALHLDRHERAQITQRARKMVEERYTWQSIARRMNDIFQSL